MTTQHWYWTAAAIAGAVALLAGLADWRRTNRRNIDAYGWMPWRGIQVAAFFAAVIILILAVKSA